MIEYTYCVLNDNGSKTFFDSSLNEEDYQKTYPNHQILHIYNKRFDEYALKQKAAKMFHDHADEYDIPLQTLYRGLYRPGKETIYYTFLGLNTRKKNYKFLLWDHNRNTMTYTTLRNVKYLIEYTNTKEQEEQNEC